MRLDLSLRSLALTVGLGLGASSRVFAAADAGPAGADLASFEQRAAADGWTAGVGEARRRAFAAAEAGRIDGAAGWLLLARWAEVLGADRREVVAEWVTQINRARLGHPNMASPRAPEAGVLGSDLRPEFIRWALRRPEFGEALFDLLTPYDALPEVLAILDRLHARDARLFEAYAPLALAIAVVHDVPPPPDWPHGQVGGTALPRRPPAPEAVFDYLVDADRGGRLLHRPALLPASQLKFVVDFAAPIAELDWAARNLRPSLAQLPSTYSMVRYREDRLARGQLLWPGGAYTLPAILAEGGICVDQAYLATQAGKARGVPTMIFRGAGKDGRHAWFGYLDEHRRWQFEAGRIAEQRLVTGVAHDPQTWGDLSDHQLQFLADDFRRMPPYRLSRQYAGLAEAFLQEDRAGDAAVAARKAVNHEPRSLEAWAILLAAQTAAGTPATDREASLRQASLAFARYPELHRRFSLALAESLRARGQISAAEQEERLLGRRDRLVRVDLAIDHAAQELARSRREDPPFEQARLYRRFLAELGAEAGMLCFDRLVRPHVQHLAGRQRLGDARQALAEARERLQPPPSSQLDTELAALADSVERGAVARP